MWSSVPGIANGALYWKRLKQPTKYCTCFGRCVGLIVKPCHSHVLSYYACVDFTRIVITSVFINIRWCAITHSLSHTHAHTLINATCLCLINYLAFILILTLLTHQISSNALQLPLKWNFNSSHIHWQRVDRNIFGYFCLRRILLQIINLQTSATNENRRREREKDKKQTHDEYTASMRI